MSSPPQRRSCPGSEARATSTTPIADADTTAAADRSRYYWRRRPRLACSCWQPCRCDWRDRPSSKRVDGYRDALDHLAEQGLAGAALLPECRELWHRGGAERRLAEKTMRRWDA